LSTGGDAVLAKFDGTTGGLLWSLDHSTTDTASDIVDSMVLGTSGEIFIAGTTRAANLLPGIFVMKVDDVPSFDAPRLRVVKSRKYHAGTSKPFDVALDDFLAIGGALSVEPRSGPHLVVFEFDRPVSSPGSVSIIDSSGASVGSASATSIENRVEASINVLPENARITVRLSNVSGTSATASASVGFLIADVTSSRSVSTTDVTNIKGFSGLAVDYLSYIYDLNLSGAVTASDILVAKGRIGQSLVP
jgi:hypothetical protein